jgi:ACS family hexuronate transporter-like MFS transporter
MVITINLTWHFFRVWLPLFLQENHAYSEQFVNYFTSAYYGAADAGSLSIGFITLWLIRQGMPIHRSRTLVFLVCALITTLSLAVAVLPAGPLLLTLILILGFGALGLFPNYYSFSQELTVRHQGKVTGSLGFSTWVASALMHPLVGRWLDQTKDYSLVVSLAGLCPLIGFGALVLLWKPAKESVTPEQG